MKIKKQNNKLAVLALSSLLVVGMVAGTLAVFEANFEVSNEFKVGQPGGKFVEEFDAPTSEIIYGGDYKKSGSVFNQGEVALYAKADIKAVWSSDTSFDGVLVDNPDPTKKEYAAILHFGNTADVTGFVPENIGVTSSNNKTASWKYDSNKNAFLYYGADGTETKQVPISAKEESNPFLSSVEFEKNDLVAAPGSPMYYTFENWNEGDKKPKDTTKGYEKQADAVDESKTSAKKGKIFFYDEKVLTHPDYKGTLNVIITCELSDEAF